MNVHSPLGWKVFQRPAARVEPVAGDIVHIALTSRFADMMHMQASAWLVGDLLVDTGFVHGASALLGALGAEPVAAVCCTHHHEDHTGSCGALQALHGCPVHLRAPETRTGEGLAFLPPYRRLCWGGPPPYEPSPYPAVVEGALGRRLRAIPTPGHSSTHVVLWEEATGTVFTGDLYVSTGASAVMSHEDPLALARSLRLVAALEPRRMLTGHGLVLADPAAALRRKAEHIEQVGEAIQERVARGMSPRRVRDEVFPSKQGHDLFLAALTMGEFSRLNFVRAIARQGSGR